MRALAGARFRSPESDADQEHPTYHIRAAGSRGGDLRQHRGHSELLQVNALAAEVRAAREKQKPQKKETTARRMLATNRELFANSIQLVRLADEEDPSLTPRRRPARAKASLKLSPPPSVYLDNYTG